jgi:glycosyl transferase family 2
VVVATDGVADVADLLAALRAQTARNHLELVVVAPDPTAVIAPGTQDVVGGVRMVVADAGQWLSAARAAGVRAATTPLVVFAENHSFPEPGWAQALIDAHAGPWAAVGPAMLNATPDEPRTWGTLLVDYGPWVAPVSGGPVDDVPGHGSAYKRSLLLDYGDHLEEILAAEWNLHQDLRSRGHRLYLEPAAATRHLNMTEAVPSFRLWQRYSRDLAAARSRDWPVAKRVLYALGTPLIFLKRLAVAVRHLGRVGRLDVLPTALAPMLASVAGSAAGELAGYASGRDLRNAPQLAHYELHRERYVSNWPDSRVGGER